MSSSSLESEDLENVPLVRMEDVQPSRNRVLMSSNPSHAVTLEVYDTFIDSLDYDNECIVDGYSNNDAIKAERKDSSDTVEFILPDVIEDDETEHQQSFAEHRITVKESPKNPESWPTLEILPGGVINHYDTFDDKRHNKPPNKDTQMVYACAKCSESFNNLFALVKHVKEHSDEAKRLEFTKTVVTDTSCKPENVNRKYASKVPAKMLPVMKMLPVSQTRKRRIPKRLKS